MKSVNIVTAVAVWAMSFAALAGENGSREIEITSGKARSFRISCQAVDGTSDQTLSLSYPNHASSLIVIQDKDGKALELENANKGNAYRGTGYSFRVQSTDTYSADGECRLAAQYLSRAATALDATVVLKVDAGLRVLSVQLSEK